MAPAAALLLAPLPALAGDARLATHTYNADEIVRIDGKLNVQATIAFGDGERIENVAVGDSDSWQIAPNKRADLLFIKPLAENARTNMTVVTDRHTYFFDLVASPKASPIYSLRFSYAPPPLPAMPAQPAVLPQSPVIAQAAPQPEEPKASDDTLPQAKPGRDRNADAGSRAERARIAEAEKRQAAEAAARRRAEEQRARDDARRQAVERDAQRRAAAVQARTDARAQAEARRKAEAQARADAKRLSDERAAARQAQDRELAEQQAAKRRQDAEAQAAQRAQARRDADQRAAAQRAEDQRRAAERSQKKQKDAEALAAQRADARRVARERDAARQAEADRLAAEQVEKRRLAERRREADRAAAQAERRQRPEPKPATRPARTTRSASAAASDAAPRPVQRQWLKTGARELYPSSIYDEGGRTIAIWPAGRPIPMLLVSDGKGHEVPVPFAVDGEKIVISGVPDRIILRSGSRSGAIQRPRADQRTSEERAPRPSANTR